MKKSKLNININKDDSDLNDFLLITHELGIRPSKFIFYSQFDAKGVWGIISNEFKVKDDAINRSAEAIPDGDGFMFNNKYCIKLNDEIYLSFIEIDSTIDGNEDRMITNFTLFYDHSKIAIESLNELVHKFDKTIISFESDLDENNSTYIKLGINGYELSSFIPSSIDKENIEHYYNDDVISKSNKLIKLINKQSKGLSLIWGDKGNGKTSLTNWISTQVEKQVIYIPSVMIDATINSPDFISFIERNNNTLLLIDDCELYIDNHFKSNMFTNNIIQLVDGVLSAHTSLHIILIYNNVDEDDILDIFDDCNSLLIDIEVTELDIDKSNDLSKFIGKNKSYKKEMRVADIVSGKKDSEINDDCEIGY